MNNKLSSLQDIDNLGSCKKLIRLFLNNNQVTQVKLIFFLIFIAKTWNFKWKLKNYRLHAIARIPSLKVLDFQKVKQKEREEAEKYLELIESNNPNRKSDGEKMDKKKILKVFFFLILKNLKNLMFWQ